MLPHTAAAPATVDGCTGDRRVAGNGAHDFPALLHAILPGYTLPRSGDHGIHHWARVAENGERITDVTGADREVVALFAIFHDCRRRNENIDPDHGLRGAELARTLRGSLVHLADDRFDLLYEACRRHTHGAIEGDPTLLACWDADRLDLGRVGIRPDRKRLCTDSARALLPWADERARGQVVPTARLAAWGLART